MTRTRKSKQDKNFSKRKRSRGVVLTTGQADSSLYCSTDYSSVPVVKTTTGSRFLGKFLSCLLLVLPAILFFSYYPLIHFGSDEAMNFEISLPIMWLLVFDVVAVVMMIRKKVLLKDFRKWWVWLLFPAFLSLSVIWSLNPVRGALTVGMLWLVYIAGYGMWRLREVISDEFRGKWWKWFFASTFLICVWCVVQCVLDLAGVGREQSLMCAGCTYAMFGFPHPNGFAIEPQFMGNLLLAPAMMIAWIVIQKRNPISIKLERKRSRGVVLTTGQADSSPYCSTGYSSVPVVKTTTGSRFLCSNFILIGFLLICTTLFLTFSRGAIYAFVVGLVAMTAWVGVREKTWRVLKVWGVAVVAFVLALGVQGVMAELSPTNDTFRSGVAKVLNHLSLGVVDVRDNADGQNFESQDEISVAGENSDVANKDAAVRAEEEKEAAFDGYVAESTDTRLRLSGAAVNVWQKDPTTMLLGVGLGGAGRALYNNGLSPAPKEIVQNQYASILLETGIIGVMLLIVTVVLVVRLVLASPFRMPILALIVAYGVTLLFFSGLPNALQIYLMPIALLTIGVSKTCKKWEFWK